MLDCQHCNKVCKNKNSHTQHERTCPKNVNRNYTNGMTGKRAWNKGNTAETCSVTEAQASRAKENYASGKRELSGIAALSHTQRSEYAKQQGFGGYNENAGRSKKYHVPDSNGKIVCLQSSYELKCAEILDSMAISWTRPSYLNYSLDGKQRKYFPDFHLTDYDIYLDPKNNYLAVLDQAKIDAVILQNNVTVLILTEDKLTTEYLTMLVSPIGEGLS